MNTCVLRGLVSYEDLLRVNACSLWVHSSCHLDGRLPLHTEEADVGDADEGPALVRPEHNDGPPLRRLCGHIKVGETNAPKIGGQTDQDVPVKGGFKRTCILTSLMSHVLYPMFQQLSTVLQNRCQ